MSIEREKIEKPFLILCEGVDALNFIICLLNSEAAKHKNPKLAEDIQVFDFGGITELDKYLSGLQLMEGYETVKNIAIVRDAEKSAEGALESVKNSLRKAGLDSPDELMRWTSTRIQTGIALFPTLGKEPENGAIEDLCLKLLNKTDKEIASVLVEEFLQSVEKKRDKKLAHRFKSKLHTVLSSSDEYVSLKIGEAAKAGAFSWDSEALDEFYGFLGEGLRLWQSMKMS